MNLADVVQKAQEICANCLLRRDDLLLCPCRSAFYCSTECQRQHWAAQHHRHCTRAERRHPGELPALRHCYACGKGSLHIHGCRCGMAYYCDTDCQRRHWPQHRSFCSSDGGWMHMYGGMMGVRMPVRRLDAAVQTDPLMFMPEPLQLGEEDDVGAGGGGLGADTAELAGMPRSARGAAHHSYHHGVAQQLHGVFQQSAYSQNSGAFELTGRRPTAPPSSADGLPPRPVPTVSLEPPSATNAATVAAGGVQLLMTSLLQGSHSSETLQISGLIGRTIRKNSNSDIVGGAGAPPSSPIFPGPSADASDAMLHNSSDSNSSDGTGDGDGTRRRRKVALNPLVVPPPAISPRVAGSPSGLPTPTAALDGSCALPPPLARRGTVMSSILTSTAAHVHRRRSESQIHQLLQHQSSASPILNLHQVHRGLHQHSDSSLAASPSSASAAFPTQRDSPDPTAAAASAAGQRTRQASMLTPSAAMPGTMGSSSVAGATAAPSGGYEDAFPSSVLVPYRGAAAGTTNSSSSSRRAVAFSSNMPSPQSHRGVGGGTMSSSTLWMRRWVGEQEAILLTEEERRSAITGERKAFLAKLLDLVAKAWARDEQLQLIRLEERHRVELLAQHQTQILGLQRTWRAEQRRF